MAIYIKNLSVANQLINNIPTTKQLMVRDGTPLAGLIKETCQALILQEGKTSYMDEVIALSNSNERHELSMDALVSLGANAVSTQFKVIRNDVRSDIDEVFKWVEESLGDTLSLKPDVVICQSYLPEIFNHQLVAGALEQYQQPATSPINIETDEYPAMTQADLFAVMCAGDSQLESALGDLVNLSQFDVVEIYDKHFRDGRIADYPRPTDMIKPYFVTFDLIESVIVFLIANGLNNNPIEGISVSLAEHRLAMAQMMRKYAYSARYRIKAREVAIKNNVVYQTTTVDVGEVYQIIVYKETYDSWLEAGGSVEVLIGLHLHRQLDQLSTISKNQYPNYIESAGQHTARRQLLLKDSRSTEVTKATAVAMERLLRDFDFELVPYTQTEAYASFRTVMNKYTYFDNMDIYEYVTKIVCVALYDYLNAYKIITAINSYCVDNPDLSPREAALLAKRDVVMDWLYSQVEVVNG